MVVAGLEMVETDWVVVGTGAWDTERGAVAREEGVRGAVAVPVAHQKVFPGGALATEGVE